MGDQEEENLILSAATICSGRITAMKKLSPWFLAAGLFPGMASVPTLTAQASQPDATVDVASTFPHVKIT